VDRLACVDVPVLPLQLLLRDNQDWKGHPVAVIDVDRPQGLLLLVNKAAWNAGVRPGQRFAAALGIESGLRAGVVSSERIRSTVAEIGARLQRHSPDVEPYAAHPGVFWVDAGGLKHLFPVIRSWAEKLREDLASIGFESFVVVGFARFGTYAVSRLRHGLTIFETRHDEDAAMRRTPLRRLDLDPASRDQLAALEINTVGDLLKHKAASLRRRFGDSVWKLRTFAEEDLFSSLQPLPHEEPLECFTEFETPEKDATRLLFFIKRDLDALLAELARRSLSLSEIRFFLRLDRRQKYEETLKPAFPTLDSAQLTGLIRLRLETLKLKAGVTDLRLVAGVVPATTEQLLLFKTHQRDLEAGSRALARLRAEFGEDVAVRPVLREAHLPSASFAWEKAVSIPEVTLRWRDVHLHPFIRRIRVKPLALPPRPRGEPDGWLLRGLEHGRVEKLHGPYLLSGGWWQKEVRRKYYFVETNRDEIFWIYSDERRKLYFLEGCVE
jgi:protein ImuB